MNNRPPTVTEAADRAVFLMAVRPRLWLYVYRASALGHLESSLGKLLLDANEQKTLTAIHYVLSSQVRDFLYNVARDVLRNLSQRASSQLEVGYRVRGHIEWDRTVKERLAAGVVDTPLFAVSRRERDFDTLENQLFKYTLDRIIAIAGDLLVAESNNEKHWLHEVQDRLKVARAHAASRLLSAVDKIATPSLLHLRAANSARNRAYRGVGSHYRFLQELVDQQSIEQLRDVLEAQYLEPMEVADLFELYVLFEVKSAVEDLGWTETEQHLIGGDHGYPVFCFQSAQTRLRIFYQRVPKVMKWSSRYRAIFEHYEALGGLRRPDVIMQIESLATGEQKYIIVEAKYSRDRRYVVDGVYKLFGYLSDFQKVLKLRIPPTGILVAMEGINRAVPADTLLNDDVILVNRDELRLSIGQVIRHHDVKIQNSAAFDQTA